MSVFDLIFIALVLYAAAAGAWIGVLAARRRRPSAMRHLKRLILALAAYAALVAAAGLLSPAHTLSPGEILRYDDWCIGVRKALVAREVGGLRAPSGREFVIVTLEVISEARRVRQAAPEGSLVYLRDGRGARYDVSEGGQAAFERSFGRQPELTCTLDPQTSYVTTRVFEVPADAGELSLAHRHGNDTVFPGVLIVGEGVWKSSAIRLPLPSRHSSARHVDAPPYLSAF